MSCPRLSSRGEQIPGAAICRPLTNETRVHDGRHDPDSCRLLLPCLPTNTAAPAENETVHAISADGEYNHRDITSCNIERCSSSDKADRGNSFAGSNVPRALVEAA